MTNSFQTEYIWIGDARIATLTAGAPDGIPVVMLHGIPANAMLFQHVIPHFTEAGYRVYAPYMPGYGETRLPDDVDYSLATVADLYAIWLQRYDLAPLWVVGHDLGGAVAQIMAARYPHIISALTLGDTVAADSFPVAPVRLLQMIARMGLYPAMAQANLIPNPYVTQSLKAAFADSASLTPAILESVFWDAKVTDEAGREEWAKHLRDLRNAENIEIAAQLATFDKPTQIVWASDDHYQHWNQVGKRLQAMFPQNPSPEFTLIGNAGHFLPLEKPHLYAVTLLDWHRRQTR